MLMGNRNKRVSAKAGPTKTGNEWPTSLNKMPSNQNVLKNQNQNQRKRDSALSSKNGRRSRASVRRRTRFSTTTKTSSNSSLSVPSKCHPLQMTAFIRTKKTDQVLEKFTHESKEILDEMSRQLCQSAEMLNDGIEDLNKMLKGDETGKYLETGRDLLKDQRRKYRYLAVLKRVETRFGLEKLFELLATEEDSGNGDEGQRVDLLLISDQIQGVGEFNQEGNQID